MKNLKKYKSVEKFTGSFAYQMVSTYGENDSLIQKIDSIASSNRVNGIDKNTYKEFCEYRALINSKYSEYKYQERN